MEKNERDAIDFGKENIPKLFRQMLIPTIIGMLFAASMTITDGIFVGRFVGSDALAAVNIVAPFFMLATGIGLMFGVGVSVVASIHLSRGRVKAANINITQAYSVSLFFTLIASALGLVFDRELAFLFGSSERLLPYVLEYLHRVLPFMAFYMLLQVGMFVIRLDGSPRFAMWCNAIPALVNLVLDYIFIVPLDWGIAGAAWAFDSGVVIGSLMIIIYTTKCSYTLRLYRIKLSRTSIRLTRRNIGYMLNIGTPAMLNEVAIACMMLIGNYVFIHYLGEDGVAAFSVACYCFPLVFMINNAIAQSAQPIISYNYGTGDFRRVRYTFRLALYTAVTCGLLAAFAVWFSIEPLIALFLEPGCNAYHIAVSGMAYFATGFLFFALNIVCIGYLQSIERARPAQLFTLLRGLLLLLVYFLTLPQWLGHKGIWLSVPASELTTFIFILSFFFVERMKDNRHKRKNT